MKYTYETHIINNRLLPFLFHKDRTTHVSGFLPNYHPNIELLFCFEGEGRVICGGQNYDFTVGDIIIINSNMLHVVESVFKNLQEIYGNIALSAKIMFQVFFKNSAYIDIETYR